MLRSSKEDTLPLPLSAKSFTFLTTKYLVNLEVFIDSLYQSERESLYSQFLKEVFMNGFWILSNLLK